MSWHLIEKILEEAGKHSTIIGKLWILSVFFFRVLIVTRIGDTIYHDEQAAFRCNNRQPGCENVCFNKYTPISYIRFCAFQIIIAALPTVFYILFAAHQVAQNEKLNPTGMQHSIFKVKLEKQQMKLQARGLSGKEHVHKHKNVADNKSVLPPAKKPSTSNQPKPYIRRRFTDKNTEGEIFSTDSGRGSQLDSISWREGTATKKDPPPYNQATRRLSLRSNSSDIYRNDDVGTMEVDKKYFKKQKDYVKKRKQPDTIQQDAITIKRQLSIAYFIQTLLRTVIEAVFLSDLSVKDRNFF